MSRKSWRSMVHPPFRFLCGTKRVMRRRRLWFCSVIVNAVIGIGRIAGCMRFPVVHFIQRGMKAHPSRSILVCILLERRMLLLPWTILSVCSQAHLHVLGGLGLMAQYSCGLM